MRYLTITILSIGLSLPAYAAKYKIDPYPAPGLYGGTVPPALSPTWANAWYSNPEVNELWTAANAELDQTKRAKMYQEMKKRISESIPDIDGQKVAEIIENMKKDFCGAIGKGNFTVSFRADTEIDALVITGSASGGIEMTVECGG